MRNNIFMKQAFLLVMLMFLPLIARAQTRLLSDFPSGTDISKTYVSKYMIDKNKGSHEYNFNGISIKDLTCIEEYNCKNSKIFNTVSFDIKDLLEKYKAKPLIMTEEGMLISGIYILYKYNESIGIAIIDSNKEAINITILHGRVE